MSTLVLQKGNLAQTIQMVFPEGGMSELAHKGFSIAAGIAGGTSLHSKLASVSLKGVEAVHKALYGGVCMAGTIYLYTDKLRFEPIIPEFLMPLYNGIESVSLDYSQIVSIERKRIKWVYPVLDITLKEGSCRFITLSGGQEIYDTINQYR